MVADRDGDAAQQVADEIGGRTWVADLSDTASLEGLSLDCDVLVNNAGV